MKLKSEYLKAAVLCYFRFERGAIVATEVKYSEDNIADLLIDTFEEIIEVEVKIDKDDIFGHEIKKVKHDFIKNRTASDLHKIPNKFYLCVPHNLEKTAKAFIEEVNTDYGLLVFDTRSKKINAKSIRVAKYPKSIHSVYNKEMGKLIIMRLCSEIVNVYLQKVNFGYSESKMDGDEESIEYDDRLTYKSEKEYIPKVVEEKIRAPKERTPKIREAKIRTPKVHGGGSDDIEIECV